MEKHSISEHHHEEGTSPKKGEARPTNTMKAIRLHEFGGPEVLRYEEAPIPDLKPGEVLVRVYAVGVNPPDWYLRDGYKMLPPDWRPPVPLPVIWGSDVSGVVEAVAPDVQGFSVGDEVFGMIRFPSYGDSAAYAEYVAAPESDLHTSQLESITCRPQERRWQGLPRGSS